MSGRTPLRIGLVGVGKIARDQHLPALAASPDFTLVAAASRHAAVDGLPAFDAIETMLADGPPLDAVSICTPPAGRDAIARVGLAAGKHVMLEKPPGVTVAEVAALARQAEAAGVTLFATWHSREAAGVDAARAWLAGRTVERATISWREDIRVWHPGQDWILDESGFGVFDPGINALSIATAILPGELSVRGGMLTVPTNRASPIAGAIDLRLGRDTPVRFDLDFLQTGPQCWDIAVESDAGTLTLTDGGKRLFIDDISQSIEPGRDEYPRLYARFATLIRQGASDVDLRPLRLVEDALRLADRATGDPFHF